MEFYLYYRAEDLLWCQCIRRHTADDMSSSWPVREPQNSMWDQHRSIFPNLRRFVIPAVFINRLQCMYLSNTTLFDGRDMYRIYYIKNNYMFRHFTLAIIRLRNEKKISKQLYSTCVYCIQWGGKWWGGYEIWHVLCRMGGVGTGVLLLYAMSRLTFRHHASYI